MVYSKIDDQGRRFRRATKATTLHFSVHPSWRLFRDTHIDFDKRRIPIPYSKKDDEDNLSPHTAAGLHTLRGHGISWQYPIHFDHLNHKIPKKKS